MAVDGQPPSRYLRELQMSSIEGYQARLDRVAENVRMMPVCLTAFGANPPA